MIERQFIFIMNISMHVRERSGVVEYDFAFTASDGHG